MGTIVSSQMFNKETKMSKKSIAVIGRWMPIHNGHKRFLVDLVKDADCDMVNIMIGSCYQGGDIRNCISATVRAIMKREGIPKNKFNIIPIPDVPTFDEWISNVMQVCKMYKATHFCTGNKEDILDVLEARNEKIDLEFINPEVGSEFPYHATDIRNLIIRGEYEKLEELIPNEIKPILFRYTFKEILAASENRGINFIEGRQVVDIILLIKNIMDDKLYILLGRRPKYKKDFPEALALPGGAINLFETATNAAIRKFYDETGLKIKMIDNSLEPAIIKLEGLPNSYLEQMHMVGIYGTHDEKLNGTRGGSSQCFAIFVEGNLEDYKKIINPHRGLTDVKFYRLEDINLNELAYQQKDMVRKAINMSDSYPHI